MTVTPPPGCAGGSAASIASALAERNASGPVWVLDDVRGGDCEPCLAIAERLGVEFRRVPLIWSAGSVVARLARGGARAGLRTQLPLSSGAPALTLSAGRRSAAVATWLRRGCGSRMVHYGAAGLHRGVADLHVCDAPGAGGGRRMAVLGPPVRHSMLEQQAAAGLWRERLDHLGRPLLALLVGGGGFGGELRPADLHQLGAALAAALHRAGGAVLAMIDPASGAEAGEALVAGLAGCPNMVFRCGEPGPDPELGVLSLADAAVVAGQADGRLLRACGFSLPVYVAAVGGGTPAQRRLHDRLIAAGQVRRLDGAIGAWPKPNLDEAGRVAGAVRALLAATEPELGAGGARS